MAKKRMFSLQIVDTDAFLEMPLSAQSLYFHLVMRADDEGFVDNPKKIMRLIGVQEDDFKILIAKRFILVFESGIIVIKHWLIHNAIRMDRFNKTVYTEEKKLLRIKENKAYTEVGKPNGNQMATNGLHKLSKVKLSKIKYKAETSSAEFSFKNKLEKIKNNKKDVRMPIIAHYWLYKNITFENEQQYSAGIKRELRAAARLKGYSLEKIKSVMYWLNGIDWLDWTLETVHKYIDKDLNKLNEKYAIK